MKNLEKTKNWNQKRFWIKILTPWSFELIELPRKNFSPFFFFYTDSIFTAKSFIEIEEWINEIKVLGKQKFYRFEHLKAFSNTWR